MSDERNRVRFSEIGVLTKEQISYGDYVYLDVLLSAQKPRSPAPDEILFIIEHQVTELWMKLVIFEFRRALHFIREDQLEYASKTLVRIARVLEQMTNAWDVMRTMTPSEFMQFRGYLEQTSGFQSYQYRTIEFIAGNRNAALLHPYASRPDILAELEAVLETPSLYDEVLRMLGRRGFDIGSDATRSNWRETRAPNDSVLSSWRRIYEEPEQNLAVYHFAERLVDVEDYFRRWRFNHLTTVERIIGMKVGTGNSSGAPYLRRMLEVVLFPELWSVRTHVGVPARG
jgi:tryptophan 2,3-dioxygenase